MVLDCDHFLLAVVLNCDHIEVAAVLDCDQILVAAVLSQILLSTTASYFCQRSTRFSNLAVYLMKFEAKNKFSLQFELYI